MQIPSIGAEALLNSMRIQMAQPGSSPQQIRQIEAQTVRQLDTLDVGSGAKGGNLDVTA